MLYIHQMYDIDKPYAYPKIGNYYIVVPKLALNSITNSVQVVEFFIAEPSFPTNK